MPVQLNLQRQKPHFLNENSDERDRVSSLKGSPVSPPPHWGLRGRAPFCLPGNLVWIERQVLHGEDTPHIMGNTALLPTGLLGQLLSLLAPPGPLVLLGHSEHEDAEVTELSKDCRRGESCTPTDQTPEPTASGAPDACH